MPATVNQPAALLVQLSSIVERIDLDTIFPARQPLEVELGCGDGSFLVNLAKLHPGRNFIGVERLLGRVRKVDRKGRRAGLVNLRGVRMLYKALARGEAVGLLPDQAPGAGEGAWADFFGR